MMIKKYDKSAQRRFRQAPNAEARWRAAQEAVGGPYLEPVVLHSYCQREHRDSGAGVHPESEAGAGVRMWRRGTGSGYTRRRNRKH